MFGGFSGDAASRKVAFYRTDEEHHSFAVFSAPEAGADHHAYETGGWTDLRDWADHFSNCDVRIWWGPGRHGPGNNLFFMIRDPHGDQIELSAEIERMPRETAARLWPAEDRTLNLWGGRLGSGGLKRPRGERRRGLRRRRRLWTIRYHRAW